MISNPSHNNNFRKQRLELWGGIEATVNRVGDQFYDQLQMNGHFRRESDIDLIAQTGIAALRYPVLWEHHASATPDWSVATARLNALREKKIRPIVGLVHHGSGPSHTNLLEWSFVKGLAAHASNVARQFPWVEDYTPVNEPLTTARFSCLYGHWYPHAKDQLSFVRALFMEVHATKAAMREIRRVNPQAKLIQTEDMGKVYSTRLLAYQAEFENERRWLSLDLLCGRVNPSHPMWGYLVWTGIDPDELKPFLEDPCPPDIIGLNHYVTSERFLDERLHQYPPRTHGGNHRHQYVDISAVRVSAGRTGGAYGVLKEAWNRYNIPTAITECHLGCTREEQLRWLMEVWRGAKRLKKEGADIRAVTVWSILGAYDWDSLLTNPRGHYEPGAFDLRSPTPRPTAIVRCMKSLSETGDFHHPIVQTEGWWRRAVRLTYKPVRPFIPKNTTPLRLWHFRSKQRANQPILITGATGTLGSGFRRLCKLRGLSYRMCTRQEMDISDPASVESFVERVRPWAIINTAGYVRVDDAERDRQKCFEANTNGPIHLACVAKKLGIALLTFSSDQVFDGNKRVPYVESDPVSPLNTYGISKAKAERDLMETLPSALIVRTSAFFGPWDDYNFVTTTLRQLRRGMEVVAAGDAHVSPTYVPDLVHASLDLLIDGQSGVWHLANEGAVTWAQLARHAAAIAGVREDLVIERKLADMNLPAPRPVFSVLQSERGKLLGSLEDAICRYFEDRGAVSNSDQEEKNISRIFEKEENEDDPVELKECVAQTT